MWGRLPGAINPGLVSACLIVPSGTPGGPSPGQGYPVNDILEDPGRPYWRLYTV